MRVPSYLLLTCQPTNETQTVKAGTPAENLRRPCRFRKTPLVVLAEADERARLDKLKTQGEDRCVSWLSSRRRRTAKPGVMPTRGAAYRDDEIQRGAGEGRHHARRRRPAAEFEGRRVQFDGAKRAVVDGPFAETKELVAGYWIWQVRSLDEAIEWVKRCPNPMPGPSEIEIRPLFEMEDFGDLVTPEVREQEERLREETEKLAKKG